jgi:hypothetical protein
MGICGELSNRWVRLGLVLALLFSAVSNAGPIQILFERNDPGIAGNELFLGTYQTLDDVVNNNLSSGVFTAIEVNNNFDVVGFTNDAAGYHMLSSATIPGSPATIFFSSLT